MKLWIDAFLVATLFMVFVLTGCVSIPTHERGLESAYHAGRQSVIWRVSGWFDAGDLDIKDMKLLIDGLKSGEFIWSAYFMGTYFPTKTKSAPKEWQQPPFTMTPDANKGDHQ